MIKVLKRLSLIVILMFCSCFMFACDDAPKEEAEIELTGEEVISEAKNKVINQFQNTKIYTDISLPTYYNIKNKYNAYISWTSSNNNIINATSGRINRTLTDQTCQLTAQVRYKDLYDSINLYLQIPANIYRDDTNGFPLKDSVEIKPCYISINKNVVKIKIKLANNMSGEIHGINDMTYSIWYNDPYKTVFASNLKYTNSNKNQFTLSKGNCIEIELPDLDLSVLNKKYLKDVKYYISISDFAYYNSQGTLSYIFFSK